MKYSIIYVLSVVAINLAFSYIPHATLSDGTIWSVGSILAGFVFVTRDYAQMEVGHKKVLALMLVAGVISYLMSNPFVAIASITAFALSEICDYLVFTYKRGTHKQKIIYSSLLSVPVDTLVFLYVIDSVSWISFIVMCASKLIAVGYIAARK
jgi:queuosine precursor transporter